MRLFTRCSHSVDDVINSSGRKPPVPDWMRRIKSCSGVSQHEIAEHHTDDIKFLSAAGLFRSEASADPQTDSQLPTPIVPTEPLLMRRFGSFETASG